jgi:hypothetical protein
LVLELRKLGFEVDAAELSNYPEPLVPDILTGADVFDVDSFARYLGDYAFALGRTQSGARRLSIATLARTEWRIAGLLCPTRNYLWGWGEPPYKTYRSLSL